MKALETLKQLGAIVTDSHVVYTSGRHGSAYVNKDALYPHADLTSEVTLAMVQPFASREIEVALAPALGGIILSQWAAHHLTRLTGREVLGVYAEKEGYGFLLRRGYDKLVSGKKVLVLEDVLTTGGSVIKAVETARAAGANVVGVAALCNRGGLTASALGVPELRSFLDVNFESWEEKDCPLCKKNVPVHTGVGKGREFLSRK
jgi:orotate phosphoribosyltransferase